MEKYFEINGVEYKIKDLSQISLIEYREIQDIINTKDENILKTIEQLLLKITDIPNHIINSINIGSLLFIDWLQVLQFNLPEHGLKKTYIINDKEYPLEDYNKMNFGKWIDLDYLKEMDIEYTVARLLKEFETQDELEEFAKLIRTEMEVIDILTITDSFNKWKSSIFKTYDGLFTTNESNDNKEDDDEDIEEEDNSIEDTVWLDTAYYLAEHILKVDDILKLSIIQVLNWLAYKKDEFEKEKEQLNKMKNSNSF